MDSMIIIYINKIQVCRRPMWYKYLVRERDREREREREKKRERKRERDR